MEKEKLFRFFQELRKRLITIVVVVFIFAVVIFTFSDEVRRLLLLPADAAYGGFDHQSAELQLIFITPSEALLANIRLAFIASATVTMPFLLYQFTALVVTLTDRSIKTAFLLTAFMSILFALGISFSYFVVLPFALNFFIGFSGADLVPTFSIARYLAFTSSFILSFGLVFQMPIVFWFLGSIGLVETAFLRRNRKYALLIIIVFASIITPPDIFSQVLMAIPLMLLYELGIFMVYISGRKKKRNSELLKPQAG